MPAERFAHADDNPSEKESKHPKNKNMKLYLIGGGVLLLGIIYFAIKRSNTNSNANAATAAANPTVAAYPTAATTAIDPATGYPEGSQADLAALGGSTSGSAGATGPAGPAGAIGAVGATGATGAVGPAGATGSTGLSGSPAPVGAWTGHYTVQAGDTLAALAAKYGTTIATLAHANVYVTGESPTAVVGSPLGTGAGLKTGQVLTVPTTTT